MVRINERNEIAAQGRSGPPPRQIESTPNWTPTNDEIGRSYPGPKRSPITRHRSGFDEPGLPKEPALRTRPQLAIELNRWTLDTGVSPAFVLGDLVYGYDC
jgi:hypothetical protein